MDKQAQPDLPTHIGIASPVLSNTVFIIRSRRMQDDKCKDDKTCVAATKKFLKLQNKAEGLASVSRKHCKNAKSLAVAAAAAASVSVAAALASVKICAASGWWFPPLCVAAVAIAAVAALAAGTASILAAIALAEYNSSLPKCEAAKAAMSSAYDKMIDDCDKECASKRQFDCNC